MRANIKNIIFILLILMSCQNTQENKEHKHIVEYTCPMHPEIVKDQPGTCPICHMDLVKRVKEENLNKVQNSSVYTCPMHPEVKQDKPGICPICKMDLVLEEPKEQEVKDSLEMVLGPTNQRIISSEKAIVPVFKNLVEPILTEGYITYDTREIQNIAPRYGGRIEKLYVKYAYQPVNKGDKLFDIYSPDVVNDSHHYVYILKNDPENKTLIDQTREKLKQLGITDAQIKNMEKTGEPDYLISVFSPETGHVHDPGNVKSGNPMSSNSESVGTNPIGSDFFNLKEGMYVERGKTVLSLLVTNKVWATIKVPSYQAKYIHLGQKISLFHENNGPALESKISFIYPFYQDGSTSMQFRADVSNHHHAFRLGEFIKVKIPISSKMSMVVPRVSVVKLGKESIVFVKKSGVFVAKSVEVGPVSQGYFPVLSGLTENDSLALNAGFLVDSESFIKPE